MITLNGKMPTIGDSDHVSLFAQMSIEDKREYLQDTAMGIIANCYASVPIPCDIAYGMEVAVRAFWNVPSAVTINIDYARHGKRLIHTADTLGYITVSVGKKKLFTMWQHFPDYVRIGSRLEGHTVKAYREYTEHTRPK